MPTYPKICISCGKPSKDPRGYRGKLGLCQKCAHKIYGGKKRKRILVTCQNCFVQYELRPKEAENRARFCSRKCYRDFYKQTGYPHIQEERICPECNKLFTINSRQKNRKYCSKQCFYKFKLKPKSMCIDCGKPLKFRTSQRCPSCAAKFSHPVITPKITHCPKCGKQSTSKSGFHGGRGLCRKCSAPEVGLKRRRRITLICPQCKTSFEAQRNIAKKNNKTFCSQKCYDEWKSQNITGDKVHNWKGGRLPYYGPNWREQRRKARARANNQCEYCGKTQEENKAALDVHHIKPFREFDYIQGENENYLQANHLDNLMALCKKCHHNAEYGKIAIKSPYLGPPQS